MKEHVQRPGIWLSSWEWKNVSQNDKHLENRLGTKIQVRSMVKDRPMENLGNCEATLGDLHLNLTGAIEEFSERE